MITVILITIAKIPTSGWYLHANMFHPCTNVGQSPSSSLDQPACYDHHDSSNDYTYVPIAGLLHAESGLASRSPFTTILCDIRRVSSVSISAHIAVPAWSHVGSAGPAPSHASMAARDVMLAWKHVTSGRLRVIPCQHGSLCYQAVMELGDTRPTWWGMPAVPALVQPFTWHPGCGMDPHVHGLSPAPGEHGHKWTLESTVSRVIPCPCGPMRS